MGKFGTFNSNDLIGKPFGLSYEILGSKAGLRAKGHVSKNTAVGKINLHKEYRLQYLLKPQFIEETAANNQEIIDNALVQKLSHEEVLKLKEQSLQGKLQTEEIIKMMVDSHSEFDKKTEFSKAKYIERKKKK